MRPLKTTEDVRRIIEDRYEGRFTLVSEYKGSLKLIRIKCSKGHVSKLKANYVMSHSIGAGCRKCDHANRTVKPNEHKNEVLKTHKGSIVPIESYIDSYTKIKYLCTNCKTEWSTLPNTVTGGHGCPRCSKSGLKLNRRISNLEYLKRIKKIHGNEIVTLTKYTTSKNKIKFKCKKEHTWYAFPSSVANGSGCPICSISKMYSKVSIAWLEIEAKKRRIKIEHAENGGEYKIPGTRYKVDGYNRRSNTVFEFYGSRWHGDPKVYSPKEKPISNGTAKELYDATIKREKHIKDLGYKIVTMWESDFYKSLKAY